MPRFMVPRFIEFVDALPQTPTMKVQKAVLRARPLAASAWDRERAGVEVPR
jgi:crotonobetaine/carnitine-CoA ligase